LPVFIASRSSEKCFCGTENNTLIGRNLRMVTSEFVSFAFTRLPLVSLISPARPLIGAVILV